RTACVQAMNLASTDCRFCLVPDRVIAAWPALSGIGLPRNGPIGGTVWATSGVHTPTDIGDERLSWGLCSAASGPRTCGGLFLSDERPTGPGKGTGSIGCRLDRRGRRIWTMPAYHPQRIEPKWQAEWERNRTFRAVDGDRKRPKLYILDMF